MLRVIGTESGTTRSHIAREGIAMSSIEVDAVSWTRRAPDLWTGRRADVPAGTIERGARFTYVDLDGEPHRGYRTLVDAQKAATAPSARPLREPGAVRRALSPMLFGAATVLLLIDGVLLGGAVLLGI
jgi:hypothetical protein